MTSVAVDPAVWPESTLAQHLDRWVPVIGEKTAVVDGASRYSFRDLAHLSLSVASGLRAAGVGAGDVVCCQLPNWVEFSVTSLAVSRLAAVLTPVPPPFRASELRFILRRTRARALIVPATFRNFDYAAMAKELTRDCPDLRAVFICRAAPPEGLRAFDELLRWPISSDPFPPGDPGALAEVIFTSGTTGEPKGVMHTSRTLYSILTPLASRLAFSRSDVCLMASTFGHQTGFLYGACLTVILGATGVWLDIWNAEAAVRLMERERVTYTMGATPFLRDFVACPALPRHDISSLRLFISAGAPIPRALVRDARERLRCAISAGWGMSENGLVTVNALDDPEDKVAGTDGAPLGGMFLRVVGPEGSPVPPDVEGELQVRGCGMFVGYWERPELTREAWTADGWFMTGDRARLDRDGYLSITGRSKDIIIRGGENISAVEVEGLLFDHPRIRAVAVVGMPDARLQERVCAFVVPAPDGPPTLEDLAAHLAARQVAKHKFPERLELLDELPMTPSGKIQKFKLRERLRP